MVVRDASGQLVKESPVGVRISILQGSAQGSAVYVETHTSQSNVNGMLSFDVGEGLPVSNTFAGIDWTNGPFFLQIETDPSGGTSYTISASNEILSVPYALHAVTADSITGTLNETDPKVPVGTSQGEMQFWNGTSWISLAPGINGQVLTMVNGVPSWIDTNKFGHFTDSRDGKTYRTIEINDQIWMADNLAWLPEVSPSTNNSFEDPYCYVYDYEGANISDAKTTFNYQTYGVLYNWPAAMNACPSGWSLPSSEEWESLFTYLGGSLIAGGKIKTVATWETPNSGATNESGFSALPAGTCFYYGHESFDNLGSMAGWWSSTQMLAGGGAAMCYFANYNSPEMTPRHDLVNIGLSVRCIKD